MAIKALGTNYFKENEFPISVYRVNRKRGITHEHDLTEKMHYHDFTEIAVVLQGNAVHYVEGNEMLVSAGDIFVLQGYQKHAFKDASNIEIVNVMFDMKKVKQILNVDTFKKIPGYKALFILEPRIRHNHQSKHILRLSRKQLARVEFIVNTMHLEQELEEVGHKTIIKNKLEELIIYLSREYSKSNSKEAIALLRISSIIDYIESHYKEELDLNQLADISCMSIRNFQRIFKKATGQSPIDYLIQVRLQKAKFYLRKTLKPVAEIALESGFKDNNYFSREFKKVLGVPPSLYRMRFKEELQSDLSDF